MIAQADGHIEKIAELADQIRRDLVSICENAISSGKVALGKYDNQEYILARLLITTALYKVRITQVRIILTLCEKSKRLNKFSDIHSALV